MKRYPLKGWEDLYEITRDGRVFNLTSGKELKPRPLEQFDKYLPAIRVSLRRNGVTKKYMVHRLVGITFIPNPKNLPQINHIDGNQQNNWEGNLEWVTNKENVQHAYRVLKRMPPNTGKFGSNSSWHKPIAKFDKADRLIKAWGSIIEASNETGYHRKSLSKNLRKTRKTLGGFIFKYLEPEDYLKWLQEANKK